MLIEKSKALKLTYAGTVAANPMSNHSCQSSIRTSSHRDAFDTSASPCARRIVLALHCVDLRMRVKVNYYVMKDIHLI